MTIGERLKQWRERVGISQREAARRAGVKQPAWCSYERDKSIPRAHTIKRLILLTEASDEPLTLEMFAEAERTRPGGHGPDESGPHAAVPARETG